MADAEDKADDGSDAEDSGKKPSKLPLIIGLVAAIGLGGGGFFAAYSGMLSGLIGGGEEMAESEKGADGKAEADSGSDTASAGSAEDESAPPVAAIPAAAFVQIEPLVVSLGSGSSLAHLRFRGHLEVAEGTEEAVTSLMPRVMDVLNGYLRAMKPEELSDPTMLIRIRAQMLRRVQLVVGDGLVKDLLVSEFVLN